MTGDGHGVETKCCGWYGPRRLPVGLLSGFLYTLVMPVVMLLCDRFLDGSLSGLHSALGTLM